MVDRTGEKGSSDDCEVCEHVDGGVCLAEIAVCNEFRDHAVFCGAEEGALDGEKDQGCQSCPEVSCKECSKGNHGDSDLNDLCRDGDFAFADTVGKLARNAREEDEWNGEAQGDIALTSFPKLALPDSTGSNSQNEDLFQDTVVDRSKKLGDDKSQEAFVEESFAFGHIRR